MNIYEQLLDNSYNNIINNIEEISKSSNMKKILITSCTEKEDKSEFVLKLGKMLASKANKKVLIVDYLENYSGKNSNEYLQSTINKTTEDEPDILKFSGVSMILQNNDIYNEMDSQIAILQSEYDYILIESYSINNKKYNDLLTCMCDGLIFLVGYNKVSINKIKEAKEVFMKCGINVLGVVFNNVDLIKPRLRKKRFRRINK